MGTSIVTLQRVLNLPECMRVTLATLLFFFCRLATSHKSTFPFLPELKQAINLREAFKSKKLTLGKLALEGTLRKSSSLGHLMVPSQMSPFQREL